MKKMNTGKLPIGQSHRKNSNFAEFSETNWWIYAGILGANFAERQSVKKWPILSEGSGQITVPCVAVAQLANPSI